MLLVLWLFLALVMSVNACRLLNVDAIAEIMSSEPVYVHTEAECVKALSDDTTRSLHISTLSHAALHAFDGLRLAKAIRLVSMSHLWRAR